MYCNSGEEAKVTYISKNGIQTTFTTKNTPINITCGDRLRTGKFIFTLLDRGYTVNCGDAGTTFTDTIVADSYTAPTTQEVTGEFSNCAWNRVNFFIGETQVSSFLKTGQFSVSSVPNPNYSPGGKILTITDSRGKNFQVEVKDCNFKVTCGDECGDGYIKCKCPGYPGYCCIPCSEIRNGIAAATAQLRSINNG